MSGEDAEQLVALAGPALFRTLRFGWAPPCGSGTTASHPRGARQSRAVPSIARSRVPDPPRGVAPPPGPRPSCAMQFRSAPLCHPWCADRGRACEDVQTSQHVCPPEAATPISFLVDPKQASATLVDTQRRRWQSVCVTSLRGSRGSHPRGDARARRRPAAVEHAGRGRSGGADGLSVGILGVLSQAVFFAGDLDGLVRSRRGCRKTGCSRRSRRRRRQPGLLTPVEAEQGLRERAYGGLVRQSASHGADSQRTVGYFAGAPRAGAGVSR